MNKTQEWTALKFQVIWIQSFQVRNPQDCWHRTGLVPKRNRTKVRLTQTRPCPGRVLAACFCWEMLCESSPQNIFWIRPSVGEHFSICPILVRLLGNDLLPAQACRSMTWQDVFQYLPRIVLYLLRQNKLVGIVSWAEIQRASISKPRLPRRHGGRWQAAPGRVGCNAWHHDGSDAHCWFDWRCLSNHWTCTMEWSAFGRFCDAIFSIYLWYQRLDFCESTTSGTGESCFLACPFSCVASLCAWHSCPGKPLSSYNQWTTFTTWSQYNANHGYFATHRYCLSDSYCNRTLYPCAADWSHWSSFIWGTTRYWCVDPLAYSTSMDFHVAYCIGRRIINFIVPTCKLAWLWSLIIFWCFESRRIASNGL